MRRSEPLFFYGPLGHPTLKGGVASIEALQADDAEPVGERASQLA